MKFNEQYTIEYHVIKFLNEELGYEYVKAEEFSKLRQFENEFIVSPLLLEAVKKINNVTDDTEAQSVVREVKKIDTNEGFLKAMRMGVDLVDSETRKTKNYRLVDFDIPDNNHFVVTNQFYFEGTLENIRPDVLVFLNGLPIVDIEAKSPTASSSVSFENAIDQLKRYERSAGRLFLPNCFNIATDGLKTVYGATYTPKQYFDHWREEGLDKQYPDEVDVTLVALLGKERLLDIIRNFLVFEITKERTIKKMARYQQMRAANKILERVREGERKKGLIWHTQGSGKSLTMFFTAWKLRYDPKLEKSQGIYFSRPH
jgi:type I restriction enzyme R subunit